MEYCKPQAGDVLGRIDEIRKYYEVWEATNGGAPLISRSMLAFSLGLSTAEEIDSLLEMLDRRGGILGIQGDQIRLAPRASAGAE